MSKFVFKRANKVFLACIVMVLCFIPMVANATATQYRLIFDDNFAAYSAAVGNGVGQISIANGGFSSPVDVNNVVLNGYGRDASPLVTGLRSLRLKFTAGYAQNLIGFSFTNAGGKGMTLDLTSVRSNGAFQFYLQPKGTTYATLVNIPSFSVELVSSYDDGGTIRLVENRIPISNYMTAADYARVTDADTTNDWTLITIPFSDLPDTGTYYDVSTGAAVSTFPFNWAAVKGIGFTCNTSATGTNNKIYDPHIDEVQLVTIPQEPTITTAIENFEFTDGAGVHVDTLAAAGNTVKAKFDFVNNTGAPKHVAGVIALYNDGVLERVQIIQQDVAIGRTAVPSVEVPNPGLDLTGLGAGTWSVKAFIWNDLDAMQPYDIVHPLS